MKNNTSKMSLRKNIIFALVPLFFFSLVVVIICRIITFNRFARHQTNIAIQGEGRYSNDPTMIWGNAPYYLEYDQRYQYNEFGIKSEPGKVKMPGKKENDFWVFLLGGSAMAGKGSHRGAGYLKITGVVEHNISDTIEHHLQKQLQNSFPDKRVRVFNASVAMHSVTQSDANYERLRHLKPDWVVSMDGHNQRIPDQGITDINFRRNDWATTGLNVFPVKQLRMIAKHSAFAYLVGEYIYYKSGVLEAPLNTPSDPKEKEYWLNRPMEAPSITPKKVAQASNETKASFNGFIRDLSLFQKKLELDGQKHLLLIQPELKMRNISKMPAVERATYNLMETIAGKRNGIELEQNLHTLFPENRFKSKNIFSMAAVHDWDGYVFVDYCHFSKEANKKIVREIAKFIETQGAYQPFPATLNGQSLLPLKSQ
jgi:hypothetical protein